MGDNDLRELLGSFVKDAGAGTATLLGTVVSVDRGNNTCTVDDDGAQYYGVRLLPVVGANKGFLSIPKINSMVLCVKIEDSDEWMVAAGTEIEKIQVVINGENIYTLASDLIKAIRAMKFTTNTGPTIALVNDPDFVALQARIDKIME